MCVFNAVAKLLPNRTYRSVPKQFFFWSGEWQLANPPKGVIQKGVVVQFVRVTYDLYWYDQDGKRGSRVTPAEIKNGTGIALQSSYVEFWPIKGSQPNGILVPDKIDSFKPGGTLAPTIPVLKDWGFPAAILDKLGDCHDTFAIHVQAQKKGQSIRGVAAIEGVAFFVNNFPLRNIAGQAWDGQSGLPGQVMWTRDLPVLTRNPTYRPAGNLLSLLFKDGLTMSKAWAKSFAPVLQKLGAGSDFSGGLYRKIVVAIDTSRNPVSNPLLVKSFEIAPKDLIQFMNDYAAVPLGFTTVPIDTMQAQEFLRTFGGSWPFRGGK